MRAFFHFILRVLFRFRAWNTEVLRTPGPVLLIPNHVSWLDWIYLYVLLDLDWKCVVSSVAARYSWVHHLIMVNRRTFPIDTASPYAAKRMAEHLAHNGRLVLFAEGQITHTGSLMKIYDGTGFLLHKTKAKLITCYIRGAVRLRWSRQPGWRRWWPTITLHFGPVLTPPPCEHLGSAAARVKLTAWLRDQMVRQQFETEMAFGPANVLEAVVRAAREQPRKVILQDVTMQSLTYRRLLIGTDLLARKLAARLVSDTARVGVLLPNVNAHPLLLLSLWELGKVPAVLNFSTGTGSMLSCARLAGLRQIITSRAFLTRAHLRIEPFAEAGLQILYLEDLRQQISPTDKLAALLKVRLNPRSLARRGMAAPNAAASIRAGSQPPIVHPDPRIEDRGSRVEQPETRSADSVAVVLFTSGSEGQPKGVELTHGNLLANMRQMLAVIDLVDGDRVFNALPMFHSFGLTVGTLLGLVRGLYVFLYPSPLHYRVVPTVLYDRHCTVFLSTSTFLHGYARKANPYDFRAVRYLFAGAEKVAEETIQHWAQRFGVRILEGYGATECGPVISVNVPMAAREGSAGRLLPGLEHRLEPVEGIANAGQLLVRGSNVMRGYLNPEADARFQALRGWYDTGDIVSVDEDGFLFIRGRLKRFAKISGEMISLAAVEEALAGAFPQFGLRCEVAVIARPDADKGEALVAVTNEPRLQLDQIRATIRAKGLANLCAPREVKYLRDIPKLGTGKVNHRELASLLEPGQKTE